MVPALTTKITSSLSKRNSIRSSLCIHFSFLLLKLSHSILSSKKLANRPVIAIIRNHHRFVLLRAVTLRNEMIGAHKPEKGNF